MQNPPGSENSIADRFEEGLRAYEARQFPHALQIFQELAAIAPYASEIQLNLGNVCFQMDRQEEAENHWKKAIETDPLEANAYLNLGNLYFKLERVQEAIDQWDVFRRLQKNHPNVLLNLGLAYDRLNDVENALECYGLFLGLCPATEEAHKLKTRFNNARKMLENNIGVAETLLERGKKEQAKEIFRKALSAYPGNARCYKTYASLLYQDGEYTEALANYLKAYHHKQDDPTILINLGVLYEKLNQPADALWAYHLARNLSSREQAQVSQRFDMLLKNRPDCLKDALQKAITLHRQGRFQEAETLLSRLQALSDYLGSIQKDVDEWFNRAQESRDPSLRAARLYMAKGQDAQDKGQFDQALNYYQKLLVLKPTGPLAEDVRGRIVNIKQMIAAVVKTMLDQGLQKDKN